jgi:hypothetical protein
MNIDGEEDQMNIDKQDEQDRQQVDGASLYGAHFETLKCKKTK